MKNAADQPANSSHQPLILIADDDKIVRFLLSCILEQNGYRVIEAEDGAHALAMYGQNHPDLILLDAMMPVLDGFSTCAQLRARPDGPGVPVIMITGLKDDEAREQTFQVGANDHFVKPLNHRLLLERVQQLLAAGHS